MGFTYQFPDLENFMFSITQHLANQNNDKDKQLAVLKIFIRKRLEDIVNEGMLNLQSTKSYPPSYE